MKLSLHAVALVERLITKGEALPSFSAEFTNPVDLRFSRFCADDMVSMVEAPVLIICGGCSLNRTNWKDRLARLSSYVCFNEVSPNPTPGVIWRALEVARIFQPRTIVGVGGGSSLDVAKIVAVLFENQWTNMFDLPSDLLRKVRLIQIPTTAGTGAEVTPWASVWLEKGQKRSVDHVSCYADLALVDPLLTDSMGPRLTAATGLDAFSHAVESIWSRNHCPFSDTLAIHALALIHTHLPSAISEGTTEDRNKMSLAALLAGLALSQCRSASAHALSYQLTARFGVEHGLAVGLMCRALMPLVAIRDPERIAIVVEALELDSIDDAIKFCDEVIRRAGLAPSLSSLGVPSDAIPGLVTKGINESRFANQPGKWCVDDLIGALNQIR